MARSSPARMAMLVGIAAAFVTGGLWMVGAFGPPPTSGRYGPVATMVIGWASIIFFGLCGVIGLTRLFDTRELLHIGSAGISFTPWSEKTIPWSAIIDVTIWSHRRQRVIVLHLANPARFPSKAGLANMLTGLNRTLTGGDVCISLTGADRSFDEAMAAIDQFRPARSPN